MRITFGLAAMASLCLLAGCNKGAANNSVNAPAPVANEIAPAANEIAAPETPAPTANEAGPSDRHASAVAECASGAPAHLPAGTDATAFCTCAVGKMEANNTPQRDAINQCATEMNITLTNAE